MSTLSGNLNGHKFHGAVDRFEVLADFIAGTYGRKIKFIADVAGGQGMLTRILRKKYNYEAEVVDPRGFTMVGVPNKKTEFNKDVAYIYDLVVGLHPDEATRAVAEGATIRPAILIPCCNFWDQTQVLGRDALIDEIAKFYDQNNVSYGRVNFGFASSKNVGLVPIPKGYSY
ncbi:MAG: hypothetical protein ACD_22C00106G0002 [uncultured bacterium]|nr:MAG: hypothetical protein ACD_22C00106G0002 [uncultured bacterium]